MGVGVLLTELQHTRCCGVSVSVCRYVDSQWYRHVAESHRWPIRWRRWRRLIWAAVWTTSSYER